MARRFAPWLIFVVLVTLVVLLGALPVPEFWITQANYIGIAALVALGLVLLTGIAGLTSFGQAAFVGLGAYTTAWLSTAGGLSPWLGLPAAILVTLVAALLIGMLTVRLSGHYLPLGTIAWGLSLYYLFGNAELLGKFDGITGIPALNLFGWTLESGRAIFWLIWLFVVLGLAAVSNLLDSRSGRAIRALRGGIVMAESCGVDTGRYKIIVFLIAAMLAGISGWLYAHMQRAVNPTPFNLNAGIEYLFMAVVGGSGHVFGALLGAAALLILKDQLQSILPALLGQTGNFEVIVFGALLVFLLQKSPQGLWPLLTGWWPRRRAGAPAAPNSDAAVEPLPRRELPARGTALLEVRHARKTFGGLVAVNDLSFDVRAGEIVALIGPNGAGKSTMFNLITRVLAPSGGEIRFAGERIDVLSSRAIARHGIARTFQHVRLMPAMSVLENVMIGAHLRGAVGPRASVLGSVLRLDRRNEARLRAEAARQIARVGLADVAGEEAGSLALGRQRVVEIARALAVDPVMLLLDEPAAGLRHLEKQALAALLSQLRAEGLAVLLVEHDMDFVMGLADRIVVMDFGTHIAEGLPADVRNNPAVLEAYLGGVD